MSAPKAMPEEEVLLYANACSGRFALKHGLQRWVKEFPSLPDAIRFVSHLPHEGTLKLILLDEVGNPLTEIILRPC